MSSGSKPYDDTALKQEQQKIAEQIANLGLYNQHRFDENVAEREMIKAIEGINKTQSQQIEDLFTDSGDFKKTFETLSGINTTQSTQIEDLFKEIKDLQTEFSGISSGASSMPGDISNLEDRIDQIKTNYDNLDLDNQLDSLAATLRGELDTRFDQLDIKPNETIDLANIRENLVSEYPELFDNSSLDTDIRNLRNRLDTFEGFKKQSADNLSDVEKALRGQIGDLSQSLTTGLGSLKSDAATALDTVYKTREQALAGLSGDFGRRLREQEASFGKQMDDSAKEMDDKIGKLGSMMNYRMLGDSAGGVKMRRSKAFRSGAVQTGTGQLARTMKLKTLNI